MVDCNTEENKSHQAAVEQRTTASSVLDGDTLVGVCDMDIVLTDAAAGT